jgi:hypothetical protein
VEAESEGFLMADKVVILTLDPDQIAALKEYSLNALDKAEKERDALDANLEIAMEALNSIIIGATDMEAYNIAVKAVEQIEYPDTKKGD